MPSPLRLVGPAALAVLIVPVGWSTAPWDVAAEPSPTPAPTAQASATPAIPPTPAAPVASAVPPTRTAPAPAPSAGSVLVPIGGYPAASTGGPGSGLPSGPVLPGAGPVNARPEVPGAPLDPDQVRHALSPLLSGGPLGRGRTPARVVDVASGKVLYSAAQRMTIPASTTKLVTAASALVALGPDAVLRTRVELRSSSAAAPRVVLVGGGDPSLSLMGAKVGGIGTSLRPASLARLARATARALSARGIVKARVRFDDSAFTGPALHPSWPTSFPAMGVVAPVSALQVDQARFDAGGYSRAPDPAASAAASFATLLEREGIAVSGSPSRVASGSGTPLASVESPTVGVLVERMLATSDNDYAEALGRLAAAADGQEASFAGVAEHAPEVLRELGVDPSEGVFVDASGLSRRNRLSPRLLTNLLRASADRFGHVSSGLPVAGATGSLRDRFDVASVSPARGVVRAKTGTLTGVVGLAGYASRPDGRLLAFAFLDDATAAGILGVRGAVDQAAATLVSCDCAAHPEAARPEAAGPEAAKREAAHPEAAMRESAHPESR